MGIHLIVDYYHDMRPARAAEYLLCLRRNLAHPDVECLWSLGFGHDELPDDINRHEKYRSEPIS